MPVIDPHGLLEGKRLAACSDLAQYLWPRFFVGADNFGRIEWHLPSIMVRCFRHIQHPPTEAELLSVVAEYELNCLALVYSVGTSMWVQFVTEEKYLSRWKTSEDKRSPEPSAALRERFPAKYEEWKRLQGQENLADATTIKAPQQRFRSSSEEFLKDSGSSSDEVCSGIRSMELGSGFAPSPTAQPLPPPQLSLEIQGHKPTNKKEPLESFMACWNEHRGVFPKIIKLTPDRRAWLVARIKDGLKLEDFKASVLRMQSAKFLQGRNDRRWWADFEFLINDEGEEHIAKLHEGKYDRGNGTELVRRES